MPGSRPGSGCRAGSTHERGDTIERCSEVTEEVVRTVFNQLYIQRVMLEGMILKPNMVLPGLTCPSREKVSEVGVGEQQYQVRLIDCRPEEMSEVNRAADATINCLLRLFLQPFPELRFYQGDNRQNWLRPA